MADLSELNASLPTKIVGAASTGGETNFVNADSNGSLFTLVKDTSGNGITSTSINSKQRFDVNSASDGADGAAAPFQTAQVGGKDASGNLQSIFVDAFGIQYGHIADLNGSSVAKVSSNGDLYTRDVIQNAIQSRAQSITTTAATAMGGATVLANRKFISLTPTNGTIYYGASAAVTTATGIPVFANQTAVLSFGDGFNVFVIAAGTVDCRIMEGA